jgi:hypothetical protein
MILVEPVRVDRERGSLLHDGGESRYATSGFIYATSRRNLERLTSGDFVVFEEHGVEQGNLLQDTFILRLQDEAGTHFVRCDTDIEPVIKREYENAQRRGENNWVTVQDIDKENEEVRFLSKEIVDFGIGSYTDSGYSLSYRHHLELDRLDTRLDHPTLMLVPEREIMFYISRKDLHV